MAKRVDETKYKSIIRLASFVLGEDIETISQLTDDQLIFFNSLSIYQLNRVFIEEEVLQGKPYSQIAKKYGVSQEHVRDIGNTLVSDSLK